MGAVTDRAEQLVELLKAEGASATCDVRQVAKAGFLVIPLPKYETPTLDGSPVVTWTVMAIVQGVGDLATARKLEDLVALAYRADDLDVESADPGSYQLPGQSDPSPAYSLTITDSLSS